MCERVSTSREHVPPKCLFPELKDVDGDYHREMNSTVFIDWFRNTLIPALEEPSLIVLDNASYHNVRTTERKAPTSSTKKGDMQHWLSERGIQFDILAKKPELYQMIKQHKPPIRYLTDDIAGWLISLLCLD